MRTDLRNRQTRAKMLTIEDIVMAYEYSKTLRPICGTEELEVELMNMTRPIKHVTRMFLTRSLRQKYLEFHLQRMCGTYDLHPVVAAMPTYPYLKEWVSSGMTLMEQDHHWSVAPST